MSGSAISWCFWIYQNYHMQSNTLYLEFYPSLSLSPFLFSLVKFLLLLLSSLIRNNFIISYQYNYWDWFFLWCGRIKWLRREAINCRINRTSQRGIVTETLWNQRSKVYDRSDRFHGWDKKTFCSSLFSSQSFSFTSIYTRQ